MSIKFLDNERARSWCGDNGFATKPGEIGVVDKREQSIRFVIPSDAGARVSLSRILYPTTWDFAGDALIWTTEWGVWPSSEHMPLAARLRQALGESRSLRDAPAAVVTREDTDDGESIVILNCLFLWDCWVLAHGGGYVAFLCHDEWGEVYCESPAVRTQLVAALDRLGADPKVPKDRQE